MIGFIIAMKEESYFLCKEIKNIEYIFYKNFNIYKGYIRNIKVVLIESGIGKTNASSATTILIIKYNPNIIFNIGCTGLINNIGSISDIFLAKKVSYHDVNITQFGYKLGQIIPNVVNFLPNKKIFNFIKNISYKFKTKILTGLILSGDSFIYDNKVIEIKKNFPKAVAIDMESASIAQICYKFSKSFIILKVISDIININSKLDFEKNLNFSINNLVKFIVKFINIIDLK